MIVSKPKVGTLFSVGIFVVLAFSLFGYGISQAIQTDDRTLWMVLIYTSGPIGLVVLIKVLMGLKFFRIGKEKFEIKFPFKFSSVRFDGKELAGWKHNAIKTYGGLYEEITWRLKSGKEYSLSKQENTEYDKALKYMRSKYKKIEVR